MGVVYRARNASGEAVALKTLRAAVVDPSLVVRFQREAEIRIEHPNVIRVLDSGVSEGTPYVALELLQGVPLADEIAAGQVTPRRIADIGRQVCAGLSAAHESGLVHRDIKPSNLFCCEDGTLKILDFGIALLADSSTRLTAPNAAPGTLGYISPEQASGHALLDGRSDLFSLGAVLYCAATGRPPFLRETALATALATLLEEPVPLSELAPQLPPHLAQAIHRALARDPADRFSSAREMAHALGSEEDRGTASRSSIRPGENRVVALLLIDGARDTDWVVERLEQSASTVVRLAGQRILAVFGAAQWTGDEVEEAAKLALELQSVCNGASLAVGRAGQSLQGEALNAVLRCAALERDGLVTDTSSAAMLRGRFTIEAIDRHFHRVGTAAAESPAAPFKLMGREIEIAQLDAAIRSVAADRRPLVVQIVGAPGIGKSRLLEELILRAGLAELNVLAAKATPLEADADLSLAGRLLSKPQPEERRHPVTPAGRDVSRARDQRRVRLLEQLMGHSTRGLVLAIDDADWTDAASLELLEELTGRAENSPLLVALTATDTIAHSWPSDEMVVRPRPLSVGAAKALVAQVAALSDSASDDIIARGEGNPLFITELALAADEKTAPVSIDAAIQSRLDRLAETDRELLHAMSLLQRAATMSELVQIAGLGVQGALTSLVRQRLLDRGGARSSRTYALRGHLLSAALRRELTDDRQRTLHRRLANALTHEAACSERAFHLESAGDEPAAATSYAQSAHRAIRLGDAATALRDAGSALRLHAKDRFGLHMLRADALRFRGDRIALGTELEQALDVATTGDERSRVLGERAVWLWRSGEQAEAERCSAQALQLAADDSIDSQVLALGRCFLVLSRTERRMEAAEYLQRARSLATKVSIELRAKVAAWWAFHLANTAGPYQRLEGYAELVEIWDELGDVRRGAGAKANLADAYNRLGAYQEAATALSAAIDDCRKVGHTTMEAYAQLNLAYAQLGLGKVDDALSALRLARVFASTLGEHRLRAWVDTYEAKALRAQGQLAKAEQAAAAATRASVGLGDVEVVAAVVSAGALLDLGRLDDAIVQGQRANELRQGLGTLEEGESELLALQARLLEAQGRLADSAEAWRRAERWLNTNADAIGDPELRQKFLASHAHLSNRDAITQ